MVGLLLKAGEDIDAQDDNGVTPLMDASKQGDLNKIKILLKYGADRIIRDNQNRIAADYTTSDACLNYIVTAPHRGVSTKSTYHEIPKPNQHLNIDDRAEVATISSLDTIYESDNELSTREVEVLFKDAKITETLCTSATHTAVIHETGHKHLKEEDAQEYDTESQTSDECDYHSVLSFDDDVYTSLVRYTRSSIRSLSSEDGTFYDAKSRFGSTRSKTSALLRSSKRSTVSVQETINESTSEESIEEKFNQDQLIVPEVKLNYSSDDAFGEDYLTERHSTSTQSSIKEDSDTESALESRTSETPCANRQNHQKHKRGVSWDGNLEQVRTIVREDRLHSNVSEESCVNTEEVGVAIHHQHCSEMSLFSEEHNCKKYEIKIPTLKRHLSDNTGYISSQRYSKEKTEEASERSTYIRSKSDNDLKAKPSISNIYLPTLTKQLHDAIRFGRSDQIHNLIVDGVDLAYADSYGVGALMVAADAYIDQTLLDDLHMLMSLGADVHQTDCLGQTALHHAIIKRNIPLVVFLISSGIDVNVRRGNGNTALIDATILVKNGIFNHTHKQKRNTKFESDSNALREIVRLLLQANADISIENEESKTAMDLILPENKLLRELSLLNEVGVSVLEAAIYMLIAAGAQPPKKQWITWWEALNDKSEVSPRQQKVVERIFNLEDWFEDIRKTVRPLIELSSIEVKKCLGSNIDGKITSLLLTPELYSYLLLDHLNDIDDN